MKKLLSRLFYTPKYGKISEKMLVERLTRNIVIIVLCMVGMALTAYAYFSVSVVSGSNTIQAANFDVDIYIEETSDSNSSRVQTAEVTVIREGANLYQASLEGGKTYTVTIRANGTVDTGFIVISAGGARYFTRQIDADKGTELVFVLKPKANMNVAFTPHFGTSSYYESFQNGEKNPFYIDGTKEITLSVPMMSAGRPSHSEQPQDPTEDPTEDTEPSQDPTEDTEPSQEPTEGAEPPVDPE